MELTSQEIKELLERGEEMPDCPRERVPLYVELKIDGETVLDKRYSPSGLFHDGPAYVYEKLTVPEGTHEIQLRMRDSRREVYNYTFTREMEFEPAEAAVIDFDENTKQFAVSR